MVRFSVSWISLIQASQCGLLGGTVLIHNAGMQAFAALRRCFNSKLLYRLYRLYRIVYHLYSLFESGVSCNWKAAGFPPRDTYHFILCSTMVQKSLSLGYSQKRWGKDPSELRHCQQIFGTWGNVMKHLSHPVTSCKDSISSPPGNY